MPLRIAYPHNVRGLADVVRNPIYSTGVGLLLYGMNDAKRNAVVSAQPRREEAHTRRGHRQERSGLERIKGWFKGNF